MNQFKKLAKVFTTWKSSSKSLSAEPKKHDDYTDAMAYLKERIASEEYKKALMERHPLMNSASNAAAQAIWPSSQGFGNTGQQLGSGNGWITPQAPLQPMETSRTQVRQFTVEKVDNGFILRSGKYSKICKDMEELSQQFIATMVEQQLDK